MNEILRFEIFIEIGVKKLLCTVHAGIGSAASYDGYFPSEQFAQSIFYNLLNTLAVWLCLPSVVTCSQVRYFKKISQSFGHQKYEPLSL